MSAYLPLLVPGLAITLLLGALAVRRGFDTAVAVTAGGLVAALLACGGAMRGAGLVNALFVLDPATLGFCGLILVCTLAVLALSVPYVRSMAAAPREEFFLLLLLAAFGALVMAVSASFITLFLGMETMGIGMIGIIAYPKFRPEAEEAGLKYLVLAGMSSGVGLFGVGLVALDTGSLALQAGGGALALAGFAMIGVAAGFKLSVVPFHLWVPDIYAGAAAPVGAFVAVVPKIAVLAVVMRVLPANLLPPGGIEAVTIIAGLSMLAGNLLALLQENVKRILGYSSISHLGNILFAIMAAGAIGRMAAVFYIVTYAVTAISAFGVLAVLSRGGDMRDTDTLDDLRGLFWSRPWLAAILTFTLLSLAGIPPAMGFTAKMYIMAAGIHANLMVLVWVMVASSVIGLFYYLRIIIVMTLREAPAAGPGGVLALPVTGLAALAVCLTLIVAFGVDPQLLTGLLQQIF